MKYIKKIGMLLILLCVVTGCKKGMKLLMIPMHVRVEDEVVCWDKVEHATSYSVMINQQVHEVTETYFNLESFSAGDYEIKIQANAKGYSSSGYSLGIKHTILLAPLSKEGGTFYHVKNRDIEILFDLKGYIIKKLSGDQLVEADYQIIDNKVIISFEYVEKMYETTRENLILSFTIVKGDETEVGYLNIKYQK